MKMLMAGIVIGGLFALVAAEVIVSLMEDYRMGKRWNKDIDKSLRKCRRDKK